MIDIATETVLSLKEAREKLPRRRNSARPDLATMYRWAQPQGVRGVRLETIMIGGTRCTNLESLQRFFNSRRLPRRKLRGPRRRRRKKIGRKRSKPRRSA